ncbi:hypothetical protein SCUP515_06514 [Seiridium cupressi]
MAPSRWYFTPELTAGPSVLAAPKSSVSGAVPEHGGETKKYRPKHGKGPTWRKKIEKFTAGEEDQNVQQGPWDPYTKFETNEDVQAFFNGFKMPMGRGKLVYRERYASWAIGEALKDFPPDGFHATGEVMQNETVSYQIGGTRKVLPKEIIDAIRADGQQDVDAEDPNPVLKKGGEYGLVQSVGGAAQALISASPNSLGPPIQACATYLQMERVGNYGRNNLSVWNSPLLPAVKFTNEANHDGLERRFVGRNKFTAQPPKKSPKGFLDNQITAIVWILSRLLGELPPLKDFETPDEQSNRQRLRGPRYGGAILADSMGLGKTLSAIASIELMVKYGLNVEIATNGRELHCPVLILCPNITVAAQWVEEIVQSTSTDSIKKILVSGGTSKHFPRDGRVTHLSSYDFTDWPERYIWDMKNWEASKTIIVMPIDTWASRTCYVETEEDETPTWHSRFTDARRYFSIVCIDEAHKVKNASTRVFKSVSLLERQFTLLITATPCLNTLTDLLGLARLLWSAAEDHLRSNPGLWEEIECFDSLEKLNGLACIEPYNDLQLAAVRPSLLTRLLCKDRRGNGQDIEETRQYLRFFESVAMLKRGPGSFIFQDWEKKMPISLEGLFPTVDSWTINIDLDRKTASEYQFAHINLLIEYIRLMENWSAIMGKNKNSSLDFKKSFKAFPTIHRQWQIASSSMDVFKLDRLFGNNDFGTTGPYITQMRSAGITFIQLAEFLLGPDEPTPQTALGYLKVAIRGSPILRYILHDLKENVLGQGSGDKITKLLITEAVPILAYYYEMVLQLIGINCRVFHSDLTQDQRKELIASFNDDAKDSVQVLIQMYTVAFAGSNLHKNCARVIVASQAHSLAVQWQAVHRVIRVGQTKNVKVLRPKVKNSYHAFRESRQIEKILPELGARVQGEMNDILVQLLNLFQYEIEDAWNSDEGQQLVEEKSLLTSLTEEPSAPARPMTPFPSQLASASSAAPIKMKDEDDADVKKEDIGGVGIKPDGADTSVIDKMDRDGWPMDFHADKKRILDQGKALALVLPEVKLEGEVQEDHQQSLGNYLDIPDTASVTSVNTTLTTTTNTSRKRVHKQPEITPAEVPGGVGWFKKRSGEDDDDNDGGDLETFLALKPRKEYYEEFKRLPKTKSHFDHGKNQLRRLLSFRITDDDGHAPKIWTVEDLDNPAVLERALELMLRVRLGAGHIEMMPFPHIDFSDVSPKKTARLQRLVANMSYTDQDIEAVQAEADAKKAAEGLKETIKGVGSSKPLSEIDKLLESEVKFGGVTRSNRGKKTQQKVDNETENEKGNLVHDDGINNDSMNSSRNPSSQLGKFSTTRLPSERQDEDDNHAEGEESDANDDLGILGHGSSRAEGKDQSHADDDDVFDSDHDIDIDMVDTPLHKYETQPFKLARDDNVKNEDIQTGISDMNEAKYERIKIEGITKKDADSWVPKYEDFVKKLPPDNRIKAESLVKDEWSKEDQIRTSVKKESPQPRTISSISAFETKYSRPNSVNDGLTDYRLLDKSKSPGFIGSVDSEDKLIKTEQSTKSPNPDTNPDDEVSITSYRSITREPDTSSMNGKWGDALYITGSKLVKRDDDSDDEIQFVKSQPREAMDSLHGSRLWPKSL